MYCIASKAHNTFMGLILSCYNIHFTSGLEATPLTRGYDCPADAEYIDAAMFDNGYGELWMKEDVLCVFEYR